MGHPVTSILAIETATPASSVAVQVNDLCQEHYEVTPRGHAAMMLPTVESLLAQYKITLSDIEVFAFGKGPGSFTGNRIAASIIQGLAYGVNRPVAAVSTLQALAQGAYRLSGVQHVLAGIDARKEQIYWAHYQLIDGVMVCCGQEQLSCPADISPPTEITHLVGQAWHVYAETLPASLTSLANVADLPYPHAQDLLPMAQRLKDTGQLIAAKQAVPTYIRDQVTG